ncbi:hypothetical protein OIU78_001696, partial [Salix suchowensis]
MIGSWNIRGLNGLNKQKAVRDWIIKNQLGLVGILETKILASNQKSVEDGLQLQSWSYFSNVHQDGRARIMVGWDPNKFHVVCVSIDHQWITCNVSSIDASMQFTVSFVYGMHSPTDRQKLWDYIMLQSSCTPQSWILMGDFNATLKASDSSGGDPNWVGHRLDFGRCLEQAELSSLPYRGLKYTWHNGRDSTNMIIKKLDWVLSNYPFTVDWPLAQSHFLPRTVSDHSAMILYLQPIEPTKAPHRFKFLNLWTSQEDFISRINSIWNQPVHGNAFYRLSTKLTLVKAHLIVWHRNNRSGISGRVVKAKEDWSTAQIQLDNDPQSEEFKEAERAAAINFNQLSRDEEAYYKQKSRIN